MTEKLTDERLANIRAFHWMKRGDAKEAERMGIDSLAKLNYEHHNDIISLCDELQSRRTLDADVDELRDQREADIAALNLKDAEIAALREAMLAAADFLSGPVSCMSPTIYQDECKQHAATLRQMAGEG